MSLNCQIRTVELRFQLVPTSGAILSVLIILIHGTICSNSFDYAAHIIRKLLKINIAEYSVKEAL